jgi:hypothetical protein
VRPLGGADGCGCIVAVNVKSTGVDDPFAFELFRPEHETVIAAAEDGAFTVVVYEDEGLRAGSVGDVDKLSFDAGAGELAGMEAGGVIVAELADVACRKSPSLAGDDGRSDLSAGHDGFYGVFDLGAADWEAADRDEGIGCVETYPNQVDFGRLLHEFIVKARVRACRTKVFAEPISGSVAALMVTFERLSVD